MSCHACPQIHNQVKHLYYCGALIRWVQRPVDKALLILFFFLTNTHTHTQDDCNFSTIMYTSDCVRKRSIHVPYLGSRWRYVHFLSWNYVLLYVPCSRSGWSRGTKVWHYSSPVPAQGWQGIQQFFHWEILEECSELSWEAQRECWLVTIVLDIVYAIDKSIA